MKYLKKYIIFERKNSFVDFKNFNLQSWYDKINTQYFGGKLKKVELRWTQSKTELGVVKYDKKSSKIEYLGVSRQFKLTKEETLSVLAHEMIHVWEVQYKKSAGHAKQFTDKAAEVNKKSKWGIQILVKQPMSHLKFLNPDLDKALGFIMIKRGDKNFEIAKFNPEQTDYKNIIEIIKQNNKGKVSIEVRSTENGVVNKFKKMSTNKELTTYKIDDVAFNTLMNDSKKITGIDI